MSETPALPGAPPGDDAPREAGADTGIGAGAGTRAGAGAPASGETRAALAAATDALLAAMPSEQARAVRLCAVPHWLDAQLLTALTGGGDRGAGSESETGLAGESGTGTGSTTASETGSTTASETGSSTASGAGSDQDVLAPIRPLRFVVWEPDGRFRLHDAVRSHLRDRLRTEDPDTWRSANAAALAHFRRASRDRQDDGGEHVEALYHLLALDEEAGLAELERRFEDAVWNHRLGLAERFVRVAHELDAELSPRARAWIAFDIARLEQLLHRGDEGIGAFEALARTAEPRLAAAAHLALAHGDVAGQHWHAAAERLREGRAALRAAGGAHHDLARFDLATGDLYRDLAVRSGAAGAWERRADPDGWWPRLRLAPFLAARAMARRWRWAPNWWWWHAGADYPDWINAWLLERATERYRRAARGFSDPGGGRDDRGEDLDRRGGQSDTASRGRADTDAALADTQLQLGRWSAARDAYRGLLAGAEVARSPHASARAELGLATIALRSGHLDEARRLLDGAADVFRRFGDQAGLARSALARAEIAERAGAPDDAARAYADAIPLLEGARDRLARTEVGARLEALAAGGRMSEGAVRAVGEARAALSEKHVLARFSGAWLTWFRRLALYVASPLTFVVGTLLLALATVLVGAVIETEARLLARGELHLVSVPDHLVLLLSATALSLAALWLYPLVYGLGGMVLVRALGRGLGRVERDQPARVVIDERGLGVFRGAGNETRAVRWPDASAAVAVDVSLGPRRVARPEARPIELLSRTFVFGQDDRPVVIEGITGQYRLLQDALAARMPLRRLGMAILEPRVLAVTLAASAAVVAVADRLGLVPVIDAVGTRPGAGEAIDLTLTLTLPAALVFLTFVMGLAIATHWRLVVHARRLRREHSLDAGIVPVGILVAAAVAWTIVGALVALALIAMGRGVT